MTTPHTEDAMTRERARVRHVKRGSTYRIIGKAQVQCPRGDPLTDYEIVVVYQSERDGEIWVRRVSEFEDGRFEKLPALASAQQEPAPSADAEEVLTIIARSIGRTTGTENYIERARDVVRSLQEADLTLPTGNAARAKPSDRGRE